MFETFRHVCSTWKMILLISEPPSFNDEQCSGDISIQEGQSGQLVCSVNGYPTPKVFWKREDDRPFLGAKAGKQSFTRRIVFRVRLDYW